MTDFADIEGLHKIPAAQLAIIGTFYEAYADEFTCYYDFPITTSHTYRGGASLSHTWPSVDAADATSIDSSTIGDFPTALYATVRMRGEGDPALYTGNPWGLASGGLSVAWQNGCPTTAGDDSETRVLATLTTDTWTFTPAASSIDLIADPALPGVPVRYVKPATQSYFDDTSGNDAQDYLWPVEALPSVVRAVEGFSSGLTGYGVDLEIALYEASQSGTWMCVL